MMCPAFEEKKETFNVTLHPFERNRCINYTMKFHLAQYCKLYALSEEGRESFYITYPAWHRLIR